MPITKQQQLQQAFLGSAYENVSACLDTLFGAAARGGSYRPGIKDLNVILERLRHAQRQIVAAIENDGAPRPDRRAAPALRKARTILTGYVGMTEECEVVREIDAALQASERPVVTGFNLDADFHFVLEDYGHKLGHAFIETDPAQATFGHVVQAIYAGAYEKVVAIIACNPVEGHSRVVTEDVARKLCEMAWRDEEEPCEPVRNLLDRFGLDYPTAETRWDDGPSPAALDAFTQGVGRYRAA